MLVNASVAQNVKICGNFITAMSLFVLRQFSPLARVRRTTLDGLFMAWNFYSFQTLEDVPRTPEGSCNYNNYSKLDQPFFPFSTLIARHTSGYV